MATEQHATIVKEWVSKFQAHLASIKAGEKPELSEYLFSDAAWRDLVAFDWDYHTIYNLDNIHKYLTDAEGENKLKKNEFQISESVKAVKEVQAGPDFGWIQAIFPFETKVGKGNGVVRLMKDSEGIWKAKTVFTALEGIKGTEEPVGQKRTYGYIDGYMPNRVNWKTKREIDSRFEGREPDVLIIGGGHSGLMLSARLKMQGVESLIVEKNERIGDNWRKRYDSLKLHDPVWMDHYPYMPFPEFWPTFPPKDKLGDWQENYAKTLELNIWNSTTLTDSAKYDEENKIWTVTVSVGDAKIAQNGTPVTRVLRPKHVVLAAGYSGDPRIPDFKNKEAFRGPVIHSSKFSSGRQFKGKKVVVIGACTSAIDIAQDLYEQGADSTLVQRSSTYIMVMPTFLSNLVDMMFEDRDALPYESDIILAGTPKQFSAPVMKAVTAHMAEIDKEKLEGLHKAGFKTNLGVDDMGFMSSYLARGGGYYIDTGACDLMINGQIKVRQGVEIASMTENTLVMTDGSTIEADAVVLATGWNDFESYAEKIIGPEARRIGPVWGLDQEEELQGVWRPTQHPALWNMLGPIALARYNSKILATQIKARLAGVV